MSENATKDSGFTAWLLAGGILLLAGMAIWQFARDPALQALLVYRQAQMAILDLVVPDTYTAVVHVPPRRFDPTTTAPIREVIADEHIALTLSWAQAREVVRDPAAQDMVTYEALAVAGDMISPLTRWPSLAILALMAYWALHKAGYQTLRTQHSIDSLMKAQSQQWPVVSPAVRFNPAEANSRAPGEPVPETLPAYLASHDPATLDFVHAACLTRLWSVLKVAGDPVERCLQRIEAHRAADGGYQQAANAASGSTYAAFLAYGAYADHRRQPPDPERLAQAVVSLADPDGGWVNDRQFPIPNVPSTSAGVALARNLQLAVQPSTTSFLLRAFQPATGGFVPFPEAPMPDLLSTAVALHALDGLQADLTRIREASLDYVDTLWTAEGGFYGQWDDDTLDLEYTYYGLLALGHLAL